MEWRVPDLRHGKGRLEQTTDRCEGDGDASLIWAHCGSVADLGHRFNSVLSRFDSFSICFSFSRASLGSIPFRMLATSAGMVWAVRARSSASFCTWVKSR